MTPEAQKRWDILHLLADDMKGFGKKQLQLVNRVINTQIKLTGGVVKQWRLPEDVVNSGKGSAEEIAILKYSLMADLPGCDPVLIVLGDKAFPNRPLWVAAGAILPERPWWAFWRRFQPTVYLIDAISEFYYPLQGSPFQIVRVMRDWIQLESIAEMLGREIIIPSAASDTPAPVLSLVQNTGS